jgi:hypothetical protein
MTPYTENKIEDIEAWNRGREAAIRRNAAKSRNRKWLAEDESREELQNFISDCYDPNTFLGAMNEALDQWGRLTEKQEVALRQTAFGGQWKMLVRDDSGFKVWGSIPSKMFDLATENGVEPHGNSFKGKRVSFTAALQPSEDDPKFGFFKRPTKPEVGA